MATRSGMDEMKVFMVSNVEVVITRTVPAPKDLVFDAWTRPEHVTNWMLGPEGWTMPVCEIDLRPGGLWRFVWQKGEGGKTMEMTGEYLEVSRPDRLVQTENWGEPWPQTHNTLVFTEENGRTVMACTIRYPTKEARDAALKTGMEDGTAVSYDRLERYLATLQLG
ncbi:SRPBCC family protein [soil metagenome]